jgi:hypothetical protein
VAHQRTQLHFYGGDVVTLEAAINDVVQALAADPGPHGLVHVRHGNTSTYVRRDCVMYLTEGKPDELAL